MIQHLPGIKKIGTLDMSSMPDHLVFKDMSGIGITINQEPTWISTVNTPKCSVTENFDCGINMEECNLSFSATQKVEKAHKKEFFIVTVDDRVFVIGDKKFNQPEIKMVYETGVPGSTPSRYDYTIKWVAYRVLIPVNISVSAS